MNQIPMLENDGTISLTALARNGDPDTSHKAAAYISYRLPALEALVLYCLKHAANGLTVDELIDSTGLDKVTASPRLRPLCNKGLVYESDERRKGKSGRAQIVWKAI